MHQFTGLRLSFAFACMVAIGSASAPAGASIVYQAANPQPTDLTGQVTGDQPTDRSLAEFRFDLLSAQIRVQNYAAPTTPGAWPRDNEWQTWATVYPVPGPLLWAATADQRYIKAFSAGDQIGVGTTISSVGPIYRLSDNQFASDTPEHHQAFGDAGWADGTRHYAGMIVRGADGHDHFGWLELSLDIHSTGAPDPTSAAYWSSGYITTRVWGWAYETQPDTPIIAGAVPEPASAALLVAVAPALLRRRRNRSTASSSAVGE